MSIFKSKAETKSNFSIDQCQRNILIFQIVGLDITVLIVPVIVLIWLEAGLAFHEMLLLQGLFVIPILILEVPSGSFADYWSRKGCSTIHHVLFSISMLIYAISNDFIGFAAAEILAGIAVAFQTGSDTALIYDSLVSIENKQEGSIQKFGEIVSKRMTIMFIGSSVGALIGGFIAEISMIRIPIFLTFIGNLIIANLVYWGYSEPPRMKAKTPKAATIKTLYILKEKNPLKAILVFSLTGLVFERLTFWAVQHILVDHFYIGPIGMGIIIAGFNACAAISSILIRKKVNDFSSILGFIGILLLDGIYTFIIIQIPGIIAILLISLLGQVTRGIRTPIIQSFLQKYLSSDIRATFISLISFIGSAFYLGISLFIDSFQLSRKETLLLSFSGILIISLLFLVLSLRNHWKTRQHYVINV